MHLIRNSFRYAGRQHRDGIVKALKPVYTAPSEQAAKDRFAEFRAEWGQRYPAIVQLWESSWAEFVPFLEYGACCRIGCCPGVVCRWWAGDDVAWPSRIARCSGTSRCCCRRICGSGFRRITGTVRFSV